MAQVYQHNWFNPILASEGQICPTKPKTLKCGQKYTKFFKTAL